MPKKPGGFAEKFHTKEESETGENEYFDIGNFVEKLSENLPKEQQIDTKMIDISHLDDPALKSEIMWGLKIEIQREVGMSRVTEEKMEQAIEEDPELPRKIAMLEKLWQDDKTQENFKTEYSRHLKEMERVNGEYEKYESLSDEIKNLENRLDELVQRLSSSEKKGEFDKAMYGSIKKQLKEKRSELQEILEDNPELSAQAAYDKMKEYKRQLDKNGYVWLPSRREKLEQLEEKLLSDRPIMMISESGAGKTTLINAAAEKFTGERASKAVGGADQKAQRLFVTRELEEDESYYKYQPLLAALSGKESNLEDEPHHSGKFFLDDEFNQRPPDVQMEIIKALTGNISPGEKFDVPNVELSEQVQPDFAYIAAGNPPSPRYDRQEIDPAVKREFAGNMLELDYLEQSKDNPELYQLMLVSLMDENGRIRAPKEEIAPEFQEGVHHDGEPFVDKDVGGFLWRFANAWRELLNSFKHEDNMLTNNDSTDQPEQYYLDELMLDMGVVVSWLEKYKSTQQGESLEEFMKDQLREFLNQPTISDSDRELAEKFLSKFKIDLDEQSEKDVSVENMTPQEIGWLLPNTPRPETEQKQPPEPGTQDVIIDGEPVEYRPESIEHIDPNDQIIPQGKEKYFNTYLGIVETEDIPPSMDYNGDEQELALIKVSPEGDDYDVINKDILTKNFEVKEQENATLEQAYDIARETGFSEEDIIMHTDVNETYDLKGTEYELESEDVEIQSTSQELKERLEKAKETDTQFKLAVRPNLTMQQMVEKTEEKFEQEGWGKPVKHKREDENFYTNEKPNKQANQGKEPQDYDKAELALITTEPIPDSKDKNYLEQTKQLIEFVQENNLYRETKEQFDQAVEEFEDKKDEIQRLLDDPSEKITYKGEEVKQWKKAADMLKELKINQLLRHSAPELLSDMITNLDQTDGDERIFEKDDSGNAIYSWTNSQLDSSHLAALGLFDSDGADVFDWFPHGTDDNVGASLSVSV